MSSRPDSAASDLRAGARVPLGTTGVEITRLGLGGTPFGNLFFAREDDDLRAAFDAAWSAGVRYFDTAPQYGGGLSEQRLGQCLSTRPREAFTLSTKVGKMLEPVPSGQAPDGIFAHGLANEVVFDYSYDAALRSIAGSLERLRVDRIDIVYVHDLNRRYHGDAVWDRYDEARAGAFRALSELRDQGVIRAMGAGNREIDVNLRMIEDVDVDCIMLPGGYTLLDRAAAENLLPACAARGVSVLLAGPYESGVLATGAADGAMFKYEPAREAVIAQVQEFARLCGEADIPLGAAALQFPFTHPAVVGIVVGMADRSEVDQATRHLETPIAAELWRALGAVRT